jgi:sec-independent protein translocase protein TatA
MVPCLPTLALFDIFSGSEMSVILIAILIFFGGDKMPGFAKGLGKAMREFRKAANEVEQEIKRAMDEAERPAPIRRPPPAVLPHDPTAPAVPPKPADEPAAEAPLPPEHPRSTPETPGYGLD